jgi:uncharacterized membrane protein
MRFWVSKVWDRIHTGYWFLPTAMAAVSIALAYGMDAADRAFRGGPTWWALAAGGPEGARALLSTSATSLVTFAGVAFSITIVALALAASQLGSKVLRTFMRDSGNQSALGVFIASTLYILLVLRATPGRSIGENADVPVLSVALALVLTVASIGMLVYFLHHVATIIQVEHVVSAVALDLQEAIERMYPGRGEESETDPEPRGSTAAVTSDRSGYLQMLDEEAVLAIAAAGDFEVRILRRPGEFFPEGEALAEAWPADRLTPAAARKLRSAFSVGRYRTVVQDVEFGIDQLVQIAIRALSPGINDTLTAISCMNWLEAALQTLARRKPPSPVLRDGRGRSRVVIRRASPRQVADAAFNLLRAASRPNAVAVHRLLDVIAAVGRVCSNAEFRSALRCHADLIARNAAEGLPSEEDRREAERRYREAVDALGGPGR